MLGRCYWKNGFCRGPHGAYGLWERDSNEQRTQHTIINNVMNTIINNEQNYKMSYEKKQGAVWSLEWQSAQVWEIRERQKGGGGGGGGDTDDNLFKNLDVISAAGSNPSAIRQTRHFIKIFILLWTESQNPLLKLSAWAAWWI